MCFEMVRLVQIYAKRSPCAITPTAILSGGYQRPPPPSQPQPPNTPPPPNSQKLSSNV